MTDTAIEAAGLGMRFGLRRRPALEGSSFRLPEGRVCALVGPDGAGRPPLLDPGARIRSLSGGRRPRVALALALGRRPSCCSRTSRRPTSTLPQALGFARAGPPSRHRLMGATFHPEPPLRPPQYAETGLPLAVGGVATAAALLLLTRRLP